MIVRPGSLYYITGLANATTLIVMFRLLILATLAIIAACQSSTPSSASLYIAHCLQGCPTGTATSNEIIVRHLYAVSINADSRTADWVSYRILPGSIGVASLLPREWQDDALAHNGLRIAELDGTTRTLERAVTGDQADSAYRVTEFQINAGDRGRLVPMTSFAGTSYWSDLNLLSVMALMKSDMRLASWARLDQAVNGLVDDEGELFVMAGPVFDSDSIRADPGASYLPAAYFKLVASSDGRMAAFLFDQELPSHASYCDQASSLDEIENLTGLNLFPAAPDWPLGSLLPVLGCGN